jgi:esterase/lipase
MAILIRGFVDQKIYTSGIGTKRVGEYLAKNGFITIAPDFLGYAGSDKESENIFESRFQTYTTILSLIKTLESLSNDITLISGDGEVTQKVIDHISLSLWGHSNGGQIALTVLEITKKPYPTVLWAPVSKPFPYSILYYTDESEDKGKFIREKLAEFEKDYDVEKYSLDNYLSEISAPIQIHQGFVDNAVPLDWSKTLFNRLGKLYEERKDTNKLEFFLNIRGLIII